VVHESPTCPEELATQTPPSPENPGSHVQVTCPLVEEQVASAEQPPLLVLHGFSVRQVFSRHSCPARQLLVVRHCTQVLVDVSQSAVAGRELQSEVSPQKPRIQTHCWLELHSLSEPQLALDSHWTHAPLSQRGAFEGQSTFDSQPVETQIPPSPTNPGSQVQVTPPEPFEAQVAFGEQPPLFTEQGSSNVQTKPSPE
jgi:hypothetical protein